MYGGASEALTVAPLRDVSPQSTTMQVSHIPISEVIRERAIGRKVVNQDVDPIRTSSHGGTWIRRVSEGICRRRLLAGGIKAGSGVRVATGGGKEV